MKQQLNEIPELHLEWEMEKQVAAGFACHATRLAVVPIQDRDVVRAFATT